MVSNGKSKVRDGADFFDVLLEVLEARAFGETFTYVGGVNDLVLLELEHVTIYITPHNCVVWPQLIDKIFKISM